MLGAANTQTKEDLLSQTIQSGGVGETDKREGKIRIELQMMLNASKETREPC